MVKKMCVHVKKLCNRCEQFPKKTEVIFYWTGKEKKAKIEKEGESKARRGESTSETEKRLDGRTLAVQRFPWEARSKSCHQRDGFLERKGEAERKSNSQRSVKLKRK